MKLTTTCKAVLAAAVTIIAIPATASAATIDMPGGVAAGDPEDLVYEAAGGESNDVVVTTKLVSNRVEFIVNDVVPIEIVNEADFDCNHVNPPDKTAVQCRPETDGFKRVILRLGNGVNRLIYTPSVPMTATGFGAVDNHFTGGPGKDELFGDDGSDTLLGRGGEDMLSGGGGDDRLAGEGANDRLFGGTGQDELINGPGGDLYVGGPGFDTVDYSLGSAAVKVNVDDAPNDGAGEGDNVKEDIEAVKGTAGNDELIDTLGGPTALFGLGGSDVIKGGPGADSTLAGGAGNDNIDGGPGNDMLFGGADQDTLTGGADKDLLMGETGQDTLSNSPGADDMSGGADFDIVSYQASTQRVTVDLGGLPGRDGAELEGDTVRNDFEQIMGGAASDTLFGNDGANLILGLDGNDVIDGRGGTDSLFGGNDSDTLRAKDGLKDSLKCGADADQVDADAIDVQTDCEGVAAPAVGIELARKRVDARGRAHVNLHCWASSAEFCKGKLQLTRGKRVIGVADYDVAAGDEETVRVRVGKRDRKLKVKAVTWASDATSFKWRSQSALTIGAAR